MSGSVSRWLGAIERLPEVVQRFQRVQIENSPAEEVICRYDTPDTLFYLDPPYVHSSRGDPSAYQYEMDDSDHEDLAALLHAIRGRAVLSGYRTPLYDALYHDWKRIEPKKCHSVKKSRQESLWINYDPESL